TLPAGRGHLPSPSRTLQRPVRVQVARSWATATPMSRYFVLSILVRVPPSTVSFLANVQAFRDASHADLINSSSSSPILHTMRAQLSQALVSAGLTEGKTSFS